MVWITGRTRSADQVGLALLDDADGLKIAVLDRAGKLASWNGAQHEVVLACGHAAAEHEVSVPRLTPRTRF